MVSKNQNASDVLHARGTDRLLADIAATPMTLEDRMRDIQQKVMKRVGDSHKVQVAYFLTGYPFYVSIEMPGGAHVYDAANDLVAAATGALNKWTAEVQRTRIAERIEREMQLASKIEAADLLTGCIFDESGGCVADTDNFYPHTEMEGGMR